MKNHRTLSMGISIVTAAMFLLTGCFAAQQDTEAMIAGKTVKTADTMSMEQEEDKMDNNNLHTIYLAGGWFWGIEAYMKKLPGVYDTDVGYANGNTENPTYEQVCYNNTGHAETVRVVYDPMSISTEQLLDGFFKVVDTTSTNRQ